MNLTVRNCWAVNMLKRLGSALKFDDFWSLLIQCKLSDVYRECNAWNYVYFVKGVTFQKANSAYITVKYFMSKSYTEYGKN